MIVLPVDQLKVDVGIELVEGLDDLGSRPLEMLEKAPIDAVLICNKEHCAAAISAARHKKHILVEKPLAFSVHQGEQMVQAAEENGVVLLVAI